MRFILFLFAAALGFAQDGMLYRVDFAIRDSSEPAAKAVRRYSMLLENGRKSVIRTGQRVPIPAPQGVQYVDVGVNIDASLRDRENKLYLTADVELSSANPQAGTPPVIANTKASLSTLVTPGKPLVLASIDDPVTQRRLDIETTVTMVK